MFSKSIKDCYNTAIHCDNLQNTAWVCLDSWGNAASQRLQNSSSPLLVFLLLLSCSCRTRALQLELRISILHTLSIVS
jgi:hypothetical protein